MRRSDANPRLRVAPVIAMTAAIVAANRGTRLFGLGMLFGTGIGTVLGLVIGEALGMDLV
ncbi:hypothetical protein Adi01nite_80260 [Amorphoplanes digitatis]|nr:hypothetical protein GCM10020092_088490 [Actinoplanes digitatis]GID98614.1 hypothetical protein Adi01nite_80260 [Actinoplanes digitatis]